MIFFILVGGAPGTIWDHIKPKNGPKKGPKNSQKRGGPGGRSPPGQDFQVSSFRLSGLSFVAQVGLHRPGWAPSPRLKYVHI